MSVRREIGLLLLIGSFSLLVGCASNETAEVPAPVQPVVIDDRGQYVGDEACGDCHDELYRSYHRTGMGRSVSRFDPNTAPERFDASSRVYNPQRDLYYEPFVRGDTLFQREFRLDDAGHVMHEQVHPAAWVVGSGNATRSYLMNVNGHITQMPLTWYVERARWDLSPGYEQKNLRFGRAISLECMTCHNGLPAHSPFTQSHYTEVPEGITCERCHGPGSAHVDARLADLGPSEGEPDPTIVNTAHLDRAVQLAVCQQCHLTGFSVFKPGHDATTYRPGQPLSAHRTVFALKEERDDPERFGIASHAERLAKSACYQNSVMTCTTCHDPHEPVADLGGDYFNEVCQGCHTPDSGEDQVMCSRDETHTAAEAMTGNCAGCHLQKSGTSDIPHVTFTDHWIRRTLPPARAPEDIERILYRSEPFELVRITEGEAGDEATARLEEAVAYFTLYDTQHRIPAYLARVIEAARRGLAGGADHPEARLALGRALAEIDSLPQAEQTLREAVARYPDHARLHYWLADVLLRSGSAATAVTHLEHALATQPAFTEAHIKLAQAREALGQRAPALRAYEEALAQNPIHHPDVWNNLGFLLIQQNQLQEADSLLSRAVVLDPDLAAALINLGSVRMLNQDLESAIALFERGAELDPTNVAPLGNLGMIYAQQGRYDDARAMFERVLALSPNDPNARAALAQVQQLMKESP